MANLVDTSVNGDLRVTGTIFGTQAGNYATCATAAGTAAKAVTISGFTLTTGIHVFVKFTVTNTAAVASLTLNVSGTGAKAMKYRGGNLPAVGTLSASRVYEFIYDGTNWELVGDLDTNTQTVTGVKGNAESSYRTGQVNLTAANIGASTSDHTHGNIQNGGTLQTNDITIANGDKLVVTDSSDSSKVARASISFDGSTTTQALTKAGTWATFNNYSHPAGSAPSKTGVPTANATPGFGGTFKVNQITTDSTSHVSAVTERTITIPNATATTSAAGLMSAADKKKLDGIAAGTASPLMDGKASVGNSLKYAREDHVHPSDTSREDIANKTTVVLGTSDSKYPTDKAVAEFVNSSIATNTANYISNNGEPFTSVEQLEAYSGPVTNNDYAFVTGMDSEGNTYYDRYKATVKGSNVTWSLEYRLNNSSFTAAQWSAINSGITSALVAKIHEHSNKDVLDGITSDKVNSWDGKEDAFDILPTERGGTGISQPNTNDLANALINSLSLGDTTPSDDDYLVSQYVKGGTIVNKYYRRPLYFFWNYIKEKISSVLGLTETNYSGKAATAGTADKAVADNSGNNIEETYATKTELSKHTGDTTVHITAAERTAWNAKQDKVSGATAGDVATLDANGNLVDSGHKLGDYKTKQTAKSDPTASGTGVTFIDTFAQNENGEITATKKTVRTMGAATASAAGSTGLVPAPGSGKQGSYLRGDGTWVVPTDTKNTAGSSNTSNKIFLIGATSQAANPQTYSHDTAYVGTDGCLYSNSQKVLTESVASNTYEKKMTRITEEEINALT